MEASTSTSIEDLLRHMNKHLAPEDRVSEDEISRVGAELKKMLGNAQSSANPNEQHSRRTLKARLAAFWEALKEKLAALLSPLTPRWQKLINMIRDKLAHIEDTGMDTLLAMVLVVVVIAIISALIKSLPLLLGLLVLMGLMGFIRLMAYATRLPRLF